MVEVNSEKFSEVSSSRNTNDKLTSAGGKSNTKTYIIAAILAIVILTLGASSFRLSSEVDMLKSELTKMKLTSTPSKIRDLTERDSRRVLQPADTAVTDLISELSDKLTAVEATAVSAGTDLEAYKSQVNAELAAISDANAKNYADITVAITSRETVIDGVQTGLTSLEATVGTVDARLKANEDEVLRLNSQAIGIRDDANKRIDDLTTIVNDNQSALVSAIEAINANIQQILTEYDPAKIREYIDNKLALLQQNVDTNEQFTEVRIQDIETKVQGNNDAIDSFNASILREMATLSSKQDSFEEYTRNSESNIIASVSTTNERVAKVETDLIPVTDLNTQFQVFLVNNDYRIRQTENNVTIIQTSITDINVRITTEVNNINTSINNYITSNDIVVNSHTDSITNINTTINNLTVHVDSEDTSIRTLVNDNKADTDAEIGLNKDAIAALQTGLSATNDNASLLRSEHDDFVTATNDSISGLTSTVGGLDERLSGEISQTNSDVSTLRGDVTALDERLSSDLSDLHVAFSEEVEATTNRFLEVNGDIDTVSGDLETAKTELSGDIEEVNETIRTPSFYTDMTYNQAMYEAGNSYDDILTLLYEGGNVFEIDPEADNYGGFWETVYTNTTNYMQYYEDFSSFGPRRLQQTEENVWPLYEFHEMIAYFALENLQSLKGRSTPAIHIGLGLESNNNGFLVNIPEDYDVLTLHIQSANVWADKYDEWGNQIMYQDISDPTTPLPWLCHIRGNWTDTGESIGSWGGHVASFGLTYNSQFEDKKGINTHGRLNIPTRRSGKLLLFSADFNACRVTGLSFAKNLHGHAASYPAIFMSAFNGGFLTADVNTVFLNTLAYYFPTAMFNNYLPFFKIPVINTGKEKMIYFTYWADSYDLHAAHTTPALGFFGGNGFGRGMQINTMYIDPSTFLAVEMQGGGSIASALPYVFEAGLSYSAVNDVEINFRSDLSNAISRGIVTPAIRYSGARFPASLTAGEDWIDFEVNSPYNVAILEIGTHDSDIL